MLKKNNKKKNKKNAALFLKEGLCRSLLFMIFLLLDLVLEFTFGLIIKVFQKNMIRVLLKFLWRKLYTGY